MSSESEQVTNTPPLREFWLLGRRLDGEHILERGSVLVRNGVIQAIDEPPPEGAASCDFGRGLICPGLVEMHFHGAMGCDFADPLGPGPASAAGYLLRQGVTAYMAAVVSSEPELAEKAVERLLLQAPPAPRLLGVFFEGPFVSPERKGAHRSECLKRPDARLARHLQSLVPPDMITAMMVAPELPGGLDLVETLVGNGVLTSIGHSSADYPTAKAAIDRGAAYGVHLWNAMAPMLHRSPGIAGALLDDDRARVELIADGVHVHPAMLRLALRAKGTDRVLLVSDCTGPAGLPAGRHEWDGNEVIVDESSVRLADGTLAGSNAGTARIFSTMRDIGVPLPEILRMRSLGPARLLGVEGCHGTIEKDGPANLAVFGADHETLCTVVDGKVAWPAGGLRFKPFRPGGNEGAPAAR